MSKTYRDGPLAFPLAYHPDNDGMEAFHEGMLLRDYFAGQALASALAHEAWSGRGTKEDVAMFAYRMADAMLATRKGGTP
jgi:hypothetical protein